MAGRSWTLAIGGVLVAALTLLFFFDPAAGLFYPPCLFRTFFGMTCPGCGTLRAMHQLLHGNLLAAWHLNPGVTVLVPILAVGFGAQAWRKRQKAVSA